MVCIGMDSEQCFFFFFPFDTAPCVPKVFAWIDLPGPFSSHALKASDRFVYESPSSFFSFLAIKSTPNFSPLPPHAYSYTRIRIRTPPLCIKRYSHLSHSLSPLSFPASHNIKRPIPTN